MGANEVVELLAAPFSMGAGAVIAVYVAQWVLSRLAAGGDGYTRKKGENLATKEDLADAVKQLKEFESARTEVAHNDWIAREWKTVRARNLEVFAARLQENYEQAQAFCTSCMSGVVPQRASNSGAEVALQSLQRLYYPELEASVAVLLDKCARVKACSSRYGRAVADAPAEPTEASDGRLGEAGELMLDAVGELRDASDAAIAKLTTLTRQLFAVDSLDKQRDTSAD
ncbi:hypothetical protein [Lysobacter capsici]|uniref:hypothetical protein n=1 Tax=Lysobacter capsici TaxID=435897 RepID=UPI00071640B9|nr:hypothetical protein [Lysobacter capsici]